MPISKNKIGRSLLGAVLGFALIYGAFGAYYRVFEPVAVNDANEIRAWQSFIEMMMGGSGAVVGFIAGFLSSIRRRKLACGSEVP